MGAVDTVMGNLTSLWGGYAGGIWKPTQAVLTLKGGVVSWQGGESPLPNVHPQGMIERKIAIGSKEISADMLTFLFGLTFVAGGYDTKIESLKAVTAGTPAITTFTLTETPDDVLQALQIVGWLNGNEYRLNYDSVETGEPDIDKFTIDDDTVRVNDDWDGLYLECNYAFTILTGFSAPLESNFVSPPLSGIIKGDLIPGTDPLVKRKVTVKFDNAIAVVENMSIGAKSASINDDSAITIYLRQAPIITFVV
jgi:hypothetical protein